MKSIERFGKRVSYNVSGAMGSWMMVEDGSDSWLYCTDRNMKLPTMDKPTYISRKGMWDLLVHFKCDKDSKKEIFNKG